MDGATEQYERDTFEDDEEKEGTRPLMNKPKDHASHYLPLSEDDQEKEE